MPANKLLFQDAEKARDSVTKSQQRQIANLYRKWAEEIGKKAEEYARQDTPSAQVMERQMEELKNAIRKAGIVTTQNITNNIQMNMYTTANTLVEVNTEWLQSLGFDSRGVAAAFGNVPMDIVQNLVTGNVYKGGWNLSKAIWGSNEQTMKDLYEVAAAGIAQNLPIYDIAKLMEQYVDPSATKPWNLKAPDGKWIYKKQVDYNAQRLARTLVQHTYQQTFQAVTKENPFVKDYVWLSNGSRVCELCKERDGKHYPKDKLPLDHPNGMCTMVPNMDSMGDISNQLADWVKSPDGKYPGIDKFAKKLGYSKSTSTTTTLMSAQSTDTAPISPDSLASKWGIDIDGMDALSGTDLEWACKDLDKSLTWAVNNLPGFSLSGGGAVSKIVFESLDCAGYTRVNSTVIHLNPETYSAAVSTHEFIHSIVNVVMKRKGIPHYDYEARDKWVKSVRKAAFEKAKMPNRKSNIGKYISDYAMVSDEEFLAEAIGYGFTQRNPNALTKATIEAFVEAVKNAIA